MLSDYDLADLDDAKTFYDTNCTDIASILVAKEFIGAKISSEMMSEVEDDKQLRACLLFYVYFIEVLSIIIEV